MEAEINDFSIPFQALTTELADHLRNTGECALIDFNDSSDLHSILIQLFLDKFNKRLEEKIDYCPITSHEYWNNQNNAFDKRDCSYWWSSGCGKTLFNSLCSYLDKFEVMQYSPYIENVLALKSLGKLKMMHAGQWLKSKLTSKYMNLWCLNSNFRYKSLQRFKNKLFSNT